MLSAIFEDREIAAILRLVDLEEESIPSFIQDGDDGTQAGIASLAERGFLVSDSGSTFTLRQDLAMFLEALVYPGTVIDLLTMEDFRPRRVSVVMKGENAYSLAILPTSFAVTELPDQQAVLELVLDHLGKPKGDILGPLTLRGRELLILMVLLGMGKVYKGELPGLGIFSPKDIIREIRKGRHIPLIAGLLMFGADEVVGNYFENKGEVESSLEELTDKGVLEKVKKGYRMSKEFLPFALSMGTPDRVTIISTVKDPDSDHPDIDTLTLFEFGEVMVLMGIIDPEEVEVDLMTIPDSDTLEYLLLSSLFLKRDLRAEKGMIASIARELLDKGEITIEEYESAILYFHAEDYTDRAVRMESTIGETRKIRCPNCGALNEPSRFCSNCGAPLKSTLE